MTQPLTLLPAVIIAIGLAAIALHFLRRLQASPGVDLDWVDRFSAARYAPLARLLSREDEEFVRAHGSRASLRRFRAERRRLFRAYLSRLRADFGRLHFMTRALVAESAVDRPDLVRALAAQKWAFETACLQAHGRLLLHAAGLGGAEVRGLLDALETMGQCGRAAVAVQRASAMA